jgi:hypothetical protein
MGGESPPKGRSPPVCARFKADEIVGGREPVRSGTVSKSQTMVLGFMRIEV